MKFLLLTMGLVAGGVAMSSSAQAQNYPWCAVLNMGDAAYNCGFLTVQQCMDSVSGIGGILHAQHHISGPRAERAAAVRGALTRAPRLPAEPRSGRSLR